jgi:hypothetical protein
MSLLATATLILSISAVALGTFVDLNKPNVTLRRHYRTILRYTTLHHLSRTPKSRLTALSTRSDPLGDLSRLILTLTNPDHHPHRTQLAYSALYAKVWAMRGSMRMEAEEIWAATLEDIKAASTCQHCPALIEKYLTEYRAGRASVYGFRLGKGRLAARILDNPRACFLKRPEMRPILRKMELELVRLYGRHVPQTLRRYLGGVYEVEGDALEAALATPVDQSEQQVVAASVSVGTSTASDSTISTAHKWGRFTSWISHLRARIHSSHAPSCPCTQHQHQELDDGQVEEKKRERFVSWLRNVRSQLADRLNGINAGNDTATAITDTTATSTILDVVPTGSQDNPDLLTLSTPGQDQQPALQDVVVPPVQPAVVQDQV